jgi:hypothetical protein
MMKSFKQYIKEETMPYAATASGSININDPDVVDGLNAIIAGVTASKFVTPYIAYERVQKALANFLIFPPRPSFFQGDSGMYTYPINQFGDKFGQRNDGSFAKDGETLKDETHGDHPPGEPLQGTIQNTGTSTSTEEKYTLYFEWRQSDCGMYNIFAEVVTESDLQDILGDLEDEMNEEEDEELNEEKFTNRAPSANPYGNLDAAKKEMNKPKPVPTRKTDDLDKLNRDAEGNTVVEEKSPGRKGEEAAGRKGSTPADQGSIAAEKEKQLKEVSPATKVSYVKKALTSKAGADFETGKNRDPFSKEFSSAMKTSTKREKGIRMAVQSLAKEEVENIKEVSDEFIRTKYLPKARAQETHLRKSMYSTKNPKVQMSIMKTLGKRVKGIGSASRKLTKDINKKAISDIEKAFTPEKVRDMISKTNAQREADPKFQEWKKNKKNK